MTRAKHAERICFACNVIPINVKKKKLIIRERFLKIMEHLTQRGKGSGIYCAFTKKPCKFLTNFQDKLFYGKKLVPNYTNFAVTSENNSANPFFSLDRQIKKTHKNITVIENFLPLAQKLARKLCNPSTGIHYFGALVLKIRVFSVIRPKIIKLLIELLFLIKS